MLRGRKGKVILGLESFHLIGFLAFRSDDPELFKSRIYEQL